MILNFAVLAVLVAQPPLSVPLSPSQPVTIEVPIFKGGEGVEFFVQCARAYELARPGVRVDLYGDPRIADKVRIRILEGSFFEVTNAGINFWPLIYNGDVLGLNQYLDGPNWEGDSTWRESFYPGLLDRYVWEGETYAVPFFYSVFAIWYNRDIFEKHDWKPPRTWTELFALCEAMEQAGIPPLAFQGRYPGYAQALIDAAYYHLAGPDRYWAQKELEPGSYDNPEFIEALGLVQRLAREHFQTGAMGMSHTDAQQEFFLGHTAMIPCGAWLKSEMKDKIPEGFRLGCFNLPSVEGGRGDPSAVTVGSNFYFVMAHSDHPELGVDFLRFMTSREQAARFAEMQDFPVATRGANEGHLSEDMDELVEIIASAKETYGVPPGEGYPEMEQHWTDWRFKLLNGDATPQECAAGLEAGAAAVRHLAENPDEVNHRFVREPAIFFSVLALAAAVAILGAVRAIRGQVRSAETSRAESGMRMSWPGRLLFLGPAAGFYTVFVVIPCVKSFGWCLYRWDGLTDMEWVGLLNFERLLFDHDFYWTAVKNNLFLMFVIPAVVLPFALFLSACLSRRIWGANLFRVVFFFPNILGVVAATLLWQQLYNPQGGLLNGALSAMGAVVTRFAEGSRVLDFVGLDRVGAWLTSFEGYAWVSQDHLYTSLIPMSVWAACGFNMVLFLAAMESVPVSLYEAAELDGASAWRQFWSITLPLIWDTVTIAVVFSVIGGMKAFEVIWLLTDQRPTSSTHVVGTAMVNSMFNELKVGEATAIAVLLFIMVFFLAAGALRAMRRERVEF